MNFCRTPMKTFASALRRRCRRQLSRGGHTLVEILLALGLSLVILVAVYAALDQHWRYAEAGQRQTEQMQVTRALFEQLSLDLRSAVFRPMSVNETIAKAGNDTQRRAARPDVRVVGRSVGIVGDGETLVVQVNRPAVGGATNGLTVQWKILAIESTQQDKGRTDASRNASARQTATATSRTVVGVNARMDSALSRMAVDPSALVPRADSASDANTDLVAEDLVAEEVESIRFRYFSGGRWFDQWNSVGRGELPSAVEVTIGFRRGTQSDRETKGESTTSETRMVIPIPASEA